MPDKKESQTRIVSPGAEPSGPANTDDIVTAVFRNTSQRVVAKLELQEGPGSGKSVPVYPGTNALGRSGDNRIVLNFGDETISRMQHALITYDEDIDEFKIYDNGKPNPVLVNGSVLKGSMTIGDGDTIKVGMTVMRFARA